MQRFTGHDILALGFPPGRHIGTMLREANEKGFIDRDALSVHLPPPQIPLTEGRDWALIAEAANADEQANLDAVSRTMTEVMRTPVVEVGAALPDACPAGEVGTIPVGGVVGSRMIHPGMHSADICCSMAMTLFPDTSPAEVLDRFHAATHFGPGGRDDMPMPPELRALIESNPMTADFVETADYHFGTQGDGNHFAFVGTMETTGVTALVTHHGSRGLGAKLYKRGHRLAKEHTAAISRDTLPVNAWLDPETKVGKIYLDALGRVAGWTIANHFALHNRVGEGGKRLWNPHNFLFRKGGDDPLFYHAKGATPVIEDSLALIPMNMASPILIAKRIAGANPAALGFAPHGAGRNFSRSEHRRRGDGDAAVELAGIDARAWSGVLDTTELPSAYKDAESVVAQIEDRRLARIVDRVLPFGAIMAGEIHVEKNRLSAMRGPAGCRHADRGRGRGAGSR